MSLTFLQPIHAADVAYHLDVAHRQQIQDALDRHDYVVLDANADYRSLAVPRIRVRTGQRIVGGWNTRVPQILVPGGVSDVEIRAVRNDALADADIVFTAGPESSGITIVGGSGGATTHARVRIDDGARVRRLRLTSYGGLDVRQRAAGYVRDSVFTGLMGYWAGPHVSWQGNSVEPSHGNAFLGIASITPQRASLWRQAGDLWFAAWDCESWNSLARGEKECFRVEDSPSVVSIGLTGGTIYGDRSGALASFRAIHSYAGWFTGARGGTRGAGDVEFHDVDSMLLVQSVNEVRETVVSRPGGARSLQLVNPLRNPAPAQMSEATASDMARALLGIATIAIDPKPVLRVPLPDLARILLPAATTSPASSTELQRRIDREGVVRLPAGVYRLDRPLKVGSAHRTEGLIGAGKDKVILVAIGDFPVLQGRGDSRYGASRETVVNLVLSDLTLYGGTHGLSITSEPGNAGDGAQIAFSTFSNLRFSHQSKSGVLVSGVFGLDSNLWYRVDFEDEPVAIRGNGSGIAAGMNYADKQHFIECQYTNIGDAVWFWTADRSSGGHIWKDNYFRNVGAISRTRAATNLLWVNSVMEEVHGPVAIDVTDTGSTATYFFYLIGCLVKGAGPRVFADGLSFGSGVMYVDTDFTQSGSVLGSEGPQALFSWDTRFGTTLRPGQVAQGILIGPGSRGGRRVIRYLWRGKETEWSVNQ